MRASDCRLSEELVGTRSGRSGGRTRRIFHGIAVDQVPTAFALVRGSSKSESQPGRTLLFGMPATRRLPLERIHFPFSARDARFRRTRRGPCVSHRRRIASAAGRHRSTVRLENGAAFPAFKDLAITSLSQDGYIEIPADQSVVEEGAVVDVTLLTFIISRVFSRICRAHPPYDRTPAPWIGAAR
jgi:hypothetical protein